MRRIGLQLAAFGGVFLFAAACTNQSPGGCGPGFCAGCCDLADKCQLGISGSACGVSGAACAACAPEQTCQAGFCAGNGGGAGGGGGGGGGGGDEDGGWPGDGGEDAGFDAGGFDAGYDAGQGGLEADAGRVTVWYTQYWHGESGVVADPSDSAAVASALAAYVRNGAAFTSYSAVQVAPGLYSIPGVPPGEYVLKIGSTYLATSADAVDLRYDVLGRPTVQWTDGGTRLVAGCSQLAAWQADSELHLVSANAGMIAYGFHTGLPAQIPLGTTAAVLNFDYASAYLEMWGGSLAPLVDTNQGDEVLLTQLMPGGLPTADGGVVNTASLARAARLSPLAVADHSTTSVAAVFSVPDSGVLNVAWDRASFEAQALVDAPSALRQYSSDYLILQAQPYTSSAGSYGSAPDLLKLSGGPDFGDLSQAISYGNPFPSSWPLAGYVNHTTWHEFTVPGMGTGYAPNSIDYWDFMPAFAAAPIAPALSAPRAFQVDGTDATTARTLTSASPTLSWLPPLQGTATHYQVKIGYFYRPAGASNPYHYPYAWLVTRNTSFTLPPGVLYRGWSYAFTVAAISMPGHDVSQTPFQYPLPMDRATTLSGLMTLP